MSDVWAPEVAEREAIVEGVLLMHQPGIRLDDESESPDHPLVTGTCWCGWGSRPEYFAWRRRSQHRAHQASEIGVALDDLDESDDAEETP